MSESKPLPSRQSPEELTLSVRGLTIGALAFGLPENPPILAVHGWMDNAASFTPLASLLEQYYVVAVDLPGHGRSDFRPEGASYFHADYALDVAHAADALGFETFILLGHSMGGGVATLVAAALPDRVERLILLDGPGPYSNEEEQTAGQLRRAIVQSLATPSKPRSYASVDELLDRRANTSKEIDRDALALIVERNARKITADDGGTAWQWSTDPRLKLASPTRLTHESVRFVLGDIRAPVLNLVASTGLMTGYDAFAGRQDQFSNARTQTIEGHHHFHFDGNVSEVALIIKEFLHATSET